LGFETILGVSDSGWGVLYGPMLSFCRTGVVAEQFVREVGRISRKLGVLEGLGGAHRMHGGG